MSGPWKHFSPELDPLIKGLEPDLIAMLDVARDRSGIPFLISSGLRTPSENERLSGAASRSAHLPDINGLSMAVDLVCDDDHSLWSMLFGLYVAGFRRMGIYFTVCKDNLKKLNPRHIHVDIASDPAHPLEVIWCQMEEN